MHARIAENVNNNNNNKISYDKDIVAMKNKKTITNSYDNLLKLDLKLCFALFCQVLFFFRIFSL